MLNGQAAGSAINPQRIAFYEFSSTNALAAHDPWSNPSDLPSLRAYRVRFDKNYDNVITIGGMDVGRSVVVWSLGKDRADNSGEGDDVASWR
jgi:hypothetical protein